MDLPLPLLVSLLVHGIWQSKIYDKDTNVKFKEESKHKKSNSVNSLESRNLVNRFKHGVHALNVIRSIFTGSKLKGLDESSASVVATPADSHGDNFKPNFDAGDSIDFDFAGSALDGRYSGDSKVPATYHDGCRVLPDKIPFGLISLDLGEDNPMYGLIKEEIDRTSGDNPPFLFPSLVIEVILPSLDGRVQMRSWFKMIGSSEIPFTYSPELVIRTHWKATEVEHPQYGMPISSAIEAIKINRSEEDPT